MEENKLGKIILQTPGGEKRYELKDFLKSGPIVPVEMVKENMTPILRHIKKGGNVIVDSMRGIGLMTIRK